MRCRRAQRWMVAAVDGELAPRRQRAFDAHVAGCSDCRHEMAGTEAVLTRVAGLATACEPPAHLEQATFRRVRQLAAAEREGAGARRWWLGLRVPALAFVTAAVAIVAFGLLRDAGERQIVSPRAGDRSRLATHTRSPEASRYATRREHSASSRMAANVPPEPPPELAAAPELFMELPILRNMEKLEHFEAIRTTTLDDGGDQSNG